MLIKPSTRSLLMIGTRPIEMLVSVPGMVAIPSASAVRCIDDTRLARLDIASNGPPGLGGWAAS